MSKYSNYTAEKEYLKDYFEASIKVHGKVKIKGMLDHVSASGMTRHISLFVPLLDDKGRPCNVCIAREVRCVGCGMDMGFDLAYRLFLSVYGVNNPEMPYQKNLDFSWSRYFW